MDRLDLLKGENPEDDALLQTDTMRFVAIVGIVFWVIFTLIKTIPLHDSQAYSSLEPFFIESGPVAATSEPKIPKVEQKPLPSVESETRTPKTENRKTKSTRKVLLDSPEPVGIHLQFKSLEALIELMSDQQVQLFGRAKTLGFDLLFAGHPKGGAVGFTPVSSLPPKLWEITSGKDHTYFLSLMSESYPVIKSFSTRQILVAFADESFENRLEETLGQLQKEGKNGILSITRKGETLFQRFVPEKDAVADGDSGPEGQEHE